MKTVLILNSYFSNDWSCRLRIKECWLWPPTWLFNSDTSCQSLNYCFTFPLISVTFIFNTRNARYAWSNCNNATSTKSNLPIIKIHGNWHSYTWPNKINCFFKKKGKACFKHINANRSCGTTLFVICNTWNTR